MGTEVLRPQDCLSERVGIAPAAFHRRKSYHGYNGYGNGYPKATNSNNSYRKPAVRLDRSSEQRRRSSGSPDSMVLKRSLRADDLRPGSRSLYQTGPTQSLVMGRVTILRRGESLDSMIKSNHLPGPVTGGEDLMVCGTDRLGPDPEIVPKQIRIRDLKSLFPPATAGGGRSEYAGSAFSVSPSPSSLPLPTFFNKKPCSKSFDDSATRDLRRLLRLE